MHSLKKEHAAWQDDPTPAKLAYHHLKSPTPWLSREVGGCIVQNMNNTFRIYKLKGQYCNTSAISRYASIKLN